MQCKEWGDANSELFKEPHDEAVHENSYKSKLYELISASLNLLYKKYTQKGAVKKCLHIFSQPLFIHNEWSNGSNGMSRSEDGFNLMLDHFLYRISSRFQVVSWVEVGRILVKGFSDSTGHG